MKRMMTAHSNLFKLFILLLLYLNETKSSKEVHSYSGINVEIITGDGAGIEKSSGDDCQLILQALEETLTSASEVLFAALDGRYYFESFNILLPSQWDEKVCIPGTTNSTARHSRSSSSTSIGGKSDIVVLTNSIQLNAQPWTQQYGGCGMNGLKVFFPQQRLSDPYSGKKFVKEWAKYKYGVFDEVATNEYKCYHDEHGNHITGCADHEFDVEQVDAVCGQEKSSNPKDIFNPISRSSLMFFPESEQVSMFCDSGNHNRYAPTKHNLICDRSSTLDVILKHEDFVGAMPQETVSQSHNPAAAAAAWPSATVMNTRPNFYYRRRGLTRYVVIIDDSLDSTVRESWGFLRSAFRKWVMYDLMDNSEVGVILTSGRSTSKTLDILELGNDTNARDLVASFLPYTPTDVRQTICVECAVDKALQMLDIKATHGNAAAAHVILLIAPGMEQGKDVVSAVRAKVRHCINRPRVATINFPAILPTRQSLDALADAALSYTINEVKYNSEKSYLTSYVQLSNVLLHIGLECHEATPSSGHAPLEIHRREIVDSTEQQIHGDFYMDNELTLPAGFFIYTHSVETPLIKAMRLMSPSGVLYQARSDQRMPVKQLTLLTSLNESGIWHYEIDRYPGNPQPHVVQVMATPKHQMHFVRAKSWIVRKLDSFLLYTSVLQGAGGTLPVLGAQVTVTVTHRDWQNNLETQILKLLDNGADATEDINADDGIYSRKLRVSKSGIYTFEFVSNGSRNGQPFARYSPILMHYVQDTELSASAQQIYLARPLNFECSTAQKNELINCAWSLDTNDAAIIGYELRYAYNLSDIIDRYDSAELLLEKKQIEAYQSGKRQRIVHNIDTTPQMYGKMIFIAMRLSYRHSIQQTVPISNVVELAVPNAIIYSSTLSPLPEYPIFPPIADGDLQDANTATTFNASNSNNKHETAVLFSQLGLQLIAICLALLFILIVLLLYCYVRNCNAKKRGHNKSTTLATATQGRTSTTPPPTIVQELVGSGGNTENTTHTARQGCNADSNYSVLEVKLQDHHTIGIPVLFAENDEENLMKGQFADTHNNLHGSNHFVNQNNSTAHKFYSGINLISTAASANYDRYTGEDSWSASQLLRDHYHHQQPQHTHTPCDSIGDNAGPPVPPLPFPLLHLPYSECSGEEGVPTKSYDYSIYHLPPHQLTEQCIVPINYDNLNDSAVSLTNAEADMQRRCRNITMV